MAAKRPAAPPSDETSPKAPKKQRVLHEMYAGGYVFSVVTHTEGGSLPVLVPIEDFTEEELLYIRDHCRVCNEEVPEAERALFESIHNKCAQPKDKGAFTNDDLRGKTIELSFCPFFVL